MRGAYFLGADKEKKFEVRDMEFKELEPHQVMIQNMAAGICGTDVHIYHGEKGSADVTPPVVLGHEYSGVVTAVGSEVTEVSVGDHVTLDPNMYCGKCRPCRMGKKQNCEHLFALGVNVNGGFAEYSVAPENQCYKLNKDVPFDVAAMAEPLACAIHGIDRTDIIPGQTVLVIGGGAFIALGQDEFILGVVLVREGPHAALGAVAARLAIQAGAFHHFLGGVEDIEHLAQFFHVFAGRVDHQPPRPG